MVYRTIGLMSGSSLDGLDIAYVQLEENGGKWNYEIIQSACYPYSAEWYQKLSSATSLNALDYQLLHTEYGRYLGAQVNQFIRDNDLHFKVQLIASHGHTSFHVPEKRMTAQLGDGAAIAATTGINVISDLRSMDLALGGQGAPIVPIGEHLLWDRYDLFLNIGGIANISYRGPRQHIAFDICPANKVLNMLSSQAGRKYDEGGELAQAGRINVALLNQLNALSYYGHPYPKSLSNQFGTDRVFPMFAAAAIDTKDGLRTFVAHIAWQVKNAIGLIKKAETLSAGTGLRLLATGGGVHNSFLMSCLTDELQTENVQIIIPDQHLVNYKEALIMALIGVLRWREENNVLASVTGASRNSIGGAIWMGQES